MNLLEVTAVQGRRMFINPARIQAIWSGPNQTTYITFDFAARTEDASYIEVQESVPEVLDRLKRV